MLVKTYLLPATAFIFRVATPALATRHHAMIRKPQIREYPEFMSRRLDQPRDDSNVTSSISYVSSFGRSEARCKEAAGPLRSVSLSYSYLVESSGAVELESIDAALLAFVAENVLECTKPIWYGHSRGTIIALRSSLDDPITSVNYCKSGVFCNVVRRTMTLDVYGGYEEEDDVILETVYSAIEDSVGWLSFKGRNVMYIRERPTIVRSQSLNVVPSNEEYSENKFSVFAGVFIVISGVGSIVAITVIRLHIRANILDLPDDTSEKQEPISIIISCSFGNTHPSERCKDIIPRNLDVEQFVFIAEEDMLERLRSDVSSARNGSCHFLDTVIEEDVYSEDEEIGI